MPSPTDRNLTALPTKTVKPTRRRQTRHFTAARPGDAACRRARRGPGSGLHGAAARALLAPRTNPKNRHEFKRINGPYTLYMVAGGGNKLPYGTLPRLLMAWSVLVTPFRLFSEEIRP